MRSLFVMMLAIPLLAGCISEDGDSEPASEEDVQAAWDDYQAATGPDGDLTGMDMAAAMAMAWGDAGMDLGLSGAAGLHTDGFQYRFLFDELVVRGDGQEQDLSGLRMDLTCDPAGLRITSDGMDGDDVDATVDVGGDCWDHEAVSAALAENDVVFSLEALMGGLRGDFGDNMALEDTEVTDDGTVAHYRVAVEGLTSSMDVLVDDGRVRQIALSMDQSMATIDMVLDMTYGERGATPAHPAS